ncbi:MAG: phosphoribosylformylglycinamidine cyclo-ligase [Candidatus Heimdallarchaeaceae archaeon]
MNNIFVPKSYEDAGINLSDETIILKKINEYVSKTFAFGEVVSRAGHYANLIKFGEFGIALVTDGVGTKLLIAQEMQKFDTIGIDCVAMNVNDLLSMGIIPKGFVDYLAVSNLNQNVIEEIIKGVYQGCEEATIPLLGGELATIPEMLAKHDYSFDIAGSAIGIVKLQELIDGSKVEVGDSILGITSSGLHSNGFTLARKVLSIKYELSEKLPWNKFVYEELLTPTRIYVKAIKSLLNECEIHGLAHITGGGFKKLFRLTKFGFEINFFPDPPPIFEEIRSLGNITYQEMFSVFNMGIGFVVIIPKEEIEKALNLLNQHFETIVLGNIKEDSSLSIPQYNVLYSR